jgi:hypothetical protein
MRRAGTISRLTKIFDQWAAFASCGQVAMLEGQKIT